MAQDMNYLPDVLDEYEQEALLDEPNLRCITGIRNYAIMILMLNTGVRTEELVNLTWDDVDLDYNELHTGHGTSRKNRTLRLTFEVVEALRNWKFRQSKEVGQCECMFTTLKGNVVSPRYVRGMIKRFGDKAMIPKQCSPVILRHTFAVKYYKTYEDIDDLARALGVRDKYNLNIYPLLADEDIDTIMY